MATVPGTGPGMDLAPPCARCRGAELAAYSLDARHHVENLVFVSLRWTSFLNDGLQVGSYDLDTSPKPLTP